MVSILDRYVTRSFLYSFAVCAIALIGLTTILDAFMRVRDFLDAAGGTIGMFSVMLQYYSVRLPVTFNTVSPAIMLTAAMFCIAQLNKNNELTPMRASGISLYRTLVPVFLFAFVLTGVLVFNQEIVIPALVGKIRQTEGMLKDAGDDAYIRLNLDDANNNNWDIPRYEKNYSTMEGELLVSAYYPGTKLRKVQIEAKSARWRQTESDGVFRWHLFDGEETRFTENGDHISAEAGSYTPRFGEYENAYVVMRPDDKVDSPFRIVTNLLPEDIVDDQTSVLHRSTSDLRRMRMLDPTRRDLAVEINSRYAFPLSNIVLLLLGLPFVLGTESRGTFGGLVVCVVICASFYAVHALCMSLGENELSPALAAWLPIALFGPLGLFLFDGVRT